MPQGVQVFDASGNSLFDSNTNTLRIAGVATFTANVTGHTISFTTGSGRDFFYFVLAAGSSGSGFRYATNSPAVTASYSSGTITINVSGIGNSDCYVNVFYGDY